MYYCTSFFQIENEKRKPWLSRNFFCSLVYLFTLSRSVYKSVFNGSYLDFTWQTWVWISVTWDLSSFKSPSRVGLIGKSNIFMRSSCGYFKHTAKWLYCIICMRYTSFWCFLLFTEIHTKHSVGWTPQYLIKFPPRMSITSLFHDHLIHFLKLKKFVNAV